MEKQIKKPVLSIGISLMMLLTGILLQLILPAGKAVAHAKGNLQAENISEAIQQLLNQESLNLYYPASVKRLYQKGNYNPLWITPQADHKHTWEAMLILDCVLEFGLSHNDYHAAELSYDQLHQIFETPGKVTVEQKAKFEITLTDALITFMNHLHYGKLNPRFPAVKIDDGNLNFNTEQALISAFNERDFMSAIVGVQPKSKAYAALQNYMHLTKGQYQGDCYEVPEAEVRKVAINMERLRWIDVDDNNLLWVNIPSYTLIWHKPDTDVSFKVIVGKPATPTPTLASNLTHFITAPDWKVPQKIFVKELLPKALADTAYLEKNQFAVYDRQGKDVPISKHSLSIIAKNPSAYYARQSAGCDNSLGLIVFRFNNPFDIYLHDTPQKQLFNKKERAFSHGCIRVEDAYQLAALLLKNDGAGSSVSAVKAAMQNYETRTFHLKRPVPVKITYLTCESKEGQIVTYKDIYNLDKALEMALYNVTEFYSKR